MHWLELQRLENEHVERALQEVAFFLSHGFPFDRRRKSRRGSLRLSRGLGTGAFSPPGQAVVATRGSLLVRSLVAICAAHCSICAACVATPFNDRKALSM